MCVMYIGCEHRTYSALPNTPATIITLFAGDVAMISSPQKKLCQPCYINQHVRKCVGDNGTLWSPIDLRISTDLLLHM